MANQEQSAPAQDQSATIDLDPKLALDRVDAWLDQAVSLLPNVLVAIVVLAVVIGIAIFAKRLVVRAARSRDRGNLGQVLGSSLMWVIVVGGGLLAATIVIPSLKTGDLIAGLGIGSVAIGFAFKDILQNWLAGLLILIRRPFKVGDQIEVEDREGTVEAIETRATMIRTYDGERIVMPNSEIYTNAVRVKTAYPKRRSEYDIGIGYGDDLDTARKEIRAVLEGIDGVEQDPEPQVLVWDLAASWVTLRARWWTDTHNTSIVEVRSEVIAAVKKALDQARIDMPYETQVHLFHDQTEAGDGYRSEQREGWPEPKNGSTQPRWRAEAEERRASEPDSDLRESA